MHGIDRFFTTAFFVCSTLLVGRSYSARVNRTNSTNNNQPTFSCRDLQNNPVDWFIIYKIPKIDNSTDLSIRSGVGFLYMDPNMQGKWVSGQVGIDNRQQPLAYTVQQVYDSSKKDSSNDSTYLMYNDEHPDSDRSYSSAGHCKGVLLFDRTSGFWLIHSVPRFPPDYGYVYPYTATKFGQSALCVTFPYASLANISDQLFLNDPSTYSYRLSPNIAKDQPVLAQVVKGKSTRKPPYTKQVDLTSKNGVRFVNFAKHRKFGEDLYTDFVAPSLSMSLYTETWQNGGGDMPSNCSGQFAVNNVDEVNLSQANAQFRDTKDHSKWAVSSTNGDYVCIGDINRQVGQLKRGGGTMCFQDNKVWGTFKNSVKKVEDCRVRKNIKFRN